MGRGMHKTLPLLAILLLTTAVGCASPEPNLGITLRTGAPPVAPPDGQGVAVECVGDASGLGGLCGYTSTDDAWWRGDSGAEFGVALGPEAGPYLVVLGFTPERTTEDQSREIEYAAYLVDAPRTGSMPEQIARWAEGVPLDGVMTTQTARGEACNGATWIAGGELSDGTVTIRFGMSASSPC